MATINTNKILDKLKSASVSSTGYTSSNEPFFRNDDNAEPFQQFNILYSDTDTQLPCGLNSDIKSMYELLGHRKKEIYCGPWTIMSVDEALEHYKILCANGQYNVFSIGYKYAGMGYIDLLNCDLSSHLLFYSVDGGSSGYDRQYNFDNLVKNGATPYDKIHFGDWFYSV